MKQGTLDRRGILWYLFIVFGLTWAVDVAMLAAGARFDQPSGPAWALPALMVTMLFPALSAYIVRKWITREGFATAGLRVGPWPVYFAILFGVPALFGIAYGLSAMAGVAEYDPSMSQFLATLREAAGEEAAALTPGMLAASTLVASLTVGPLITAGFTFGEEFGWTGYLLPKLLPLGKWRAAILYGLIWGLWHAPIIAAGYNYPGYPVIGPIAMCAFTVALGLTMTALRLRYDSVLITSWMHALINSQGRGVWMLLFTGVHPLLGGITGLPGLLLLGVLGLWLLSRTPEPESASAPAG